MDPNYTRYGYGYDVTNFAVSGTTRTFRVTATGHNCSIHVNQVLAALTTVDGNHPVGKLYLKRDRLDTGTYPTKAEATLPPTWIGTVLGFSTTDYHYKSYTAVYLDYAAGVVTADLTCDGHSYGGVQFKWDDKDAWTRNAGQAGAFDPVLRANGSVLLNDAFLFSRGMVSTGKWPDGFAASGKIRRVQVVGWAPIVTVETEASANQQLANPIWTQELQISTQIMRPGYVDPQPVDNIPEWRAKAGDVELRYFNAVVGSFPLRMDNADDGNATVNATGASATWADWRTPGTVITVELSKLFLRKVDHKKP